MNRHPDILSGEEMSVFSNNTIFENFSLIKKYPEFFVENGVPDFPTSPFPFHPGRVFLTDVDNYRLSHNEIFTMLKKSENTHEFLFKLKNSVLKSSQKKIWAEKTPENIHAVGNFLNTFNNQEAKVIHIVRNPKDVILSLMNRNYSFFSAAERWITSVAAIQPYVNNKNVLEISYEDLVLKPEIILNQVCEFLGVSFNYEDFQAQNNNSGVQRNHQISSWNNSPFGKISSSSLNKHKTSSINFDILYNMKLSKDYANFLGQDHISFRDLANKYGY